MTSVPSTGPASDPRLFKELDQAVVHSEAWGSPDLQDAQEWPLGWHHPPQRLQADREALQEGRLLLQAIPPSWQVYLGRQGEQTYWKYALFFFFQKIIYSSYS